MLRDRNQGVISKPRGVRRQEKGDVDKLEEAGRVQPSVAWNRKLPPAMKSMPSMASSPRALSFLLSRDRLLSVIISLGSLQECISPYLLLNACCYPINYTLCV